MGISRYLHSTIRHANRLYLFGGYDESQSLQHGSVWVTDAASQYRFSACPPMPQPVARPALALWQDQYVYLLGGYGEAGVPRQHIQRYDLHTQTWAEVKPGKGQGLITFNSRQTFGPLLTLVWEPKSFFGSPQIHNPVIFLYRFISKF
jgi:hypothetical protein